ncbi:MAG: hypothetical protein F6J98_46195 [Moorea sp. SIO4G2]|uniref:hypothetical protein n=1 Tax=unclassified Moorena TaxID=2683338 RepID=UPI0013CD3CA6|nr:MULTISPECIES: hypothetical protein [unclassified Moorena]NEO24155.1 hypothetical protein [Moorena sp. SIO4A5]NEO67355.1 hypothetical protein [Moorena sp. SIO4G2]NEQ57670.1 hypothetical protein [Moorena sp. SIO4A1]
MAFGHATRTTLAFWPLGHATRTATLREQPPTSNLNPQPNKPFLSKHHPFLANVAMLNL